MAKFKFAPNSHQTEPYSVPSPSLRRRRRNAPFYDSLLPHLAPHCFSFSRSFASYARLFDGELKTAGIKSDYFSHAAKTNMEKSFQNSCSCKSLEAYAASWHGRLSHNHVQVSANLLQVRRRMHHTSDMEESVRSRDKVDFQLRRRQKRLM